PGAERDGLVRLYRESVGACIGSRVSGQVRCGQRRGTSIMPHQVQVSRPSGPAVTKRTRRETGEPPVAFEHSAVDPFISHTMPTDVHRAYVRSASDVMALQRSAGNQHVTRLLGKGQTTVNGHSNDEATSPGL